MSSVAQIPADWLTPHWPVNARVRACVTTASSGNSSGPFAHFNVAEHVGDEPKQVQYNREWLARTLACTPVWIEQVHGIDVVPAIVGRHAVADASFTRDPGVACAIMTADCLPVLFAARDGSCVAAAHAGWRSLVAGVLENTLDAMQVQPRNVIAWLGPGIGPQVYEVGPEVREAFLAQHQHAEKAFMPSARDGHWMADLYQLACMRLKACGVTDIYGGGFCTYSDTRFYSYRRQTVTGRFASLIWLAEP